MTVTTPSHSEACPAAPSGMVLRTLGLIYGSVVYAIFVATFLYAIGFVTRFLVPKTVNSGGTMPPLYAVVVDLVLLALFAVQHSGMARRGFKRVFTRYLSPAIERSTYVLCTSLVLIALFTFWQPINAVVWHIDDLALAFSVQLVSMYGWLIVLYSTFLISHSELFGLKQVVLNFLGRAAPDTTFKTPGLYRRIRHPLYLGFIIAFWATPTMTVGNLLFATVMTAYIFIGIALEERDLIATFGEQYRRYKARVAVLLPGVF
jgi:protein-S-isoprenylcysteine O-methyltransferase Ste14